MFHCTQRQIVADVLEDVVPPDQLMSHRNIPGDLNLHV